MEVDERFLTLLTPEGEFLRARKQKQDYLIGEEIDFFPVSENKKKKSSFLNLTFGKALPAAACAIIIAAASFMPFNNSNDVYAYMSIDVNPSIELAVNDKLEVVNLEAYNVEGKRVLSEIKDWDHKEVSVVTTSIIEEIKEQGYFENHDKVVISTVFDDKKELKVEEQLKADIEQIEEKIEKENLQLTVVNATKQERKEAHKQGISTGVYKEKHQTVKKKEIEKQQGKSDSLKDVEKDKQPHKQTNGKDKIKNDKKAKNEKENNNVDSKDVKKELKNEKGKNQLPQKTKNESKKNENKQDKRKLEGKEKKTMDDDPQKKNNHIDKEDKKNNKNNDRDKNNEKNQDKNKNQGKNKDKHQDKNKQNNPKDNHKNKDDN
jgi:hypothetical protein